MSVFLKNLKLHSPLLNRMITDTYVGRNLDPQLLRLILAVEESILLSGSDQLLFTEFDLFYFILMSKNSFFLSDIGYRIQLYSCPFSA